MDLSKRVDWINGTGYSKEMGDIAIEIHINEGGKSGFEFWHEGGASEAVGRRDYEFCNTRNRATQPRN